MSQLRVCLRMALEAGVMMPAIAMRAAHELSNFNMFNKSAIHPFSAWFDEEHFISRLQDACPQMLISDANKQPLVKMGPKVGFDLSSAEGYSMFDSWAWSGRTWHQLFWGTGGLPQSMQMYEAALMQLGLPAEGGPKLVSIYTPFLFFRVTQDIIGHDQRGWNEFNHLIRFRPASRRIVHQLMEALGNTRFFGVHYRGEKDKIWSSTEVQLDRNLQLAEEAWQIRHQTRSPGGLATTQTRDLRRNIYLACGDENAIKEFKREAARRDWEVLDKDTLAREADAQLNKPSGVSLIDQINALPFDHQASIDLGLSIVSEFFIGFTGSAFSWTAANARDPLGRYRRPTLSRSWDEDALLAGSHLFNDGETLSIPAVSSSLPCKVCSGQIKKNSIRRQCEYCHMEIRLLLYHSTTL